MAARRLSASTTLRGPPTGSHRRSRRAATTRPRRPFDPLARPGDPLHPSADGSIEGLTKRGASFFVCNNALMGLATFLATSSPFGGGRGVDAILADLQAHLAPGAILVPAGVAALNAAQEAKFTYVAAS